MKGVKVIRSAKIMASQNFMDTSFQVLDTSFQVLDTHFQVLDTSSQILDKLKCQALF